MKCVFHREEYITNFCKSQKCLLPLCPVCVKLHSQQHTKNCKSLIIEKHGIFELIDICIEEVRNQLMDSIKSISGYHSKGRELTILRKQMESALLEKLDICKERAMEQLDRQFEEFQNQVNAILIEKQRQMQQQLARMNQIADNSRRQSQYVNNSKQILQALRNPESCLETLIHYYYEHKARINQWQNIATLVDQKLRISCQNRGLQFHANMEALTGLKNFVPKFMSLTTKSLPLPSDQHGRQVSSSSRAQYICSYPNNQNKQNQNNCYYSYKRGGGQSDRRRCQEYSRSRQR